MIKQKYPSGREVVNELDADGSLSVVKSKKSQTAGFWNYAQQFTYTAAGAVSSMQLGNGTWESTTFNSRLQPTQIALGSLQNGTDKLKLNFDYGTSANNGNVLSQTILVPTAGTANPGFKAVQTYTYDQLNRIQDAKENINDSSTPEWKQTFKYDRYGNRRFNTDNNNTTTFEASCPTAICNPEVSPSNNRLVGYSFDNAGNTTTDAQNKQFIYDAENKQTEFRDLNITNPPGYPDTNLKGRYWYDGDGKRVKKIGLIGGEWEETIFVYDASSRLVAEYSNQVEPIETARVSYLTNDHLGSPRITTNKDGGVISRRDFMPFGEEISTTQRTAGLGYVADAVRQKFTSYERDGESGLDFAKARYFNSGFGRFSSPDPLLYTASRPSDPQKFNLYVYVRNNPLALIDPTGLDGGRAVSAVFNPDGTVTENPLEENDRKALEKGLRRLAPGSRVLKDGTIKRPGFFRRILNRLSGHSAGTRLVSEISKANVLIRVNHNGRVGALSTDARGQASKENILGGVSAGATVNWDPNFKASATTISNDGSLVEYAPSSAAVLGHELIHAYNKTRPPGDKRRDFERVHLISQGDKIWGEKIDLDEHRAVGYGYNYPGDITENQLLKELGESPRVAYNNPDALYRCDGIFSSGNECR